MPSSTGKRTYSRRNMTMVPSSMSSSPDDVRNSAHKRRKPSPQDEAVDEPKSVSSSKSPGRKAKFKGPISLPEDGVVEMDVDKVSASTNPPADPFKHLLDIKPKAKPGTIHGSRDEFNATIKANIVPKNGGRSRFGSLAGALNPMKKDGTSTKRTVKPPTKMEVLSMARRTFEAREYLAATIPPPSTNLLGNRIKTRSRQATMWAENQVKSPLLRLPHSVREMIYQLALGGRNIEIHYKTFDLKETNHSVYAWLPKFKYRSVVSKESRTSSSSAVQSFPGETIGMKLLNGVCRQLYSETSTLPYKLNNITFREYNTMFNFFVMEKRLTSSQCNVITQLTVEDELPGANVLVRLPNLLRVQLLSSGNMAAGWYHVVQDKKGLRLEKEGASAPRRWSWKPSGFWYGSGF